MGEECSTYGEKRNKGKMNRSLARPMLILGNNIKVDSQVIILVEVDWM
jgi:hypothetical protein